MKRTITILTVLTIIIAITMFNSCKEPPTEAPVIITEIKGTVLDKNTGAALQGVQISTLPVTSSVVTTTDGSYIIEDVDPNSYKVSAQKEGYETNTINVTVAEGKSVTADILLEVYKPTQITGKIYDKKTNAVLSGVQVSTQPNTTSVITGSDGEYILEDITPGDYKVTAKKDEYNSTTINVTAKKGKTITADIHLDSQNPELKVTPEVLDFDVAQTNLTFSISNISKVGELTWTIAINQPWITVTPTSGSTTTETDIVTATVSRDNVDYGNYSAQITINSDYGVEQINVMMVKADPNNPQLTVIPTELNFAKENNSKTVIIKNTGSGTLNWTATTNESWILLSDNSGNVTGGNAFNLSISLSKVNLDAGDYTGTIYINSNSGNQIVSVSMTVEEGTLNPPVLQITGDATKTSIPLGWTKVNDANFSNYKLYRSIISNIDENSTLVTTITNSDQNTYTDEGLSSGTVYYYKIYVYSKTGIGSGSNEVSATTSRDISSWVSTETISSLSGGISKNSMDVISENDIWLCGGKEIWHYNGSVWSKSFTNTEDGYFMGISFANPNKGWAIYSNGSSSSLYEYNGISWTKVSNLTFSSPRDIIAFSESNIWILGEGEVYHFDGSNWTTTTLGIGNGVDLDATLENNIWAVGNRGKVFHYNGVGWGFVYELPHPVSGTYYPAISTVDDNDVWVTQSHTYSTHTLWHYDGSDFEGKSVLNENNRYDGQYALEMLSSNEGWSCNSSSRNISYDFKYYDGSTWRDVKNPVNSYVQCIKFLTRDKGWAVTRDGTILRYVE